MQASLEQQRAKALADQTAQWVQLMAEMDANSKAGSSGGGGSGGGGRRGGGSSGSSKVTESATETQTLYDPQFLADYEELRKINPAAANAMMEAYLGSESSPSVKAITGAIQTTSDNIAANYGPGYNSQFFNNSYADELRRNPFVAAPGAMAKQRKKEEDNKKNRSKLQTQQTARNYLLRSSGTLGNPSTKQTVTIKGK
jgi:hypothetical protein